MRANNYCNGPFRLSQVATKKRRCADDGNKPPPLRCYGGGPNCGKGEGKGGNKKYGNELDATDEFFPIEHLGKMKDKDRRCHWCLKMPGQQRNRKRKRH